MGRRVKVSHQVRPPFLHVMKLHIDLVGGHLGQRVSQIEPIAQRIFGYMVNILENIPDEILLIAKLGNEFSFGGDAKLFELVFKQKYFAFEFLVLPDQELVIIDKLFSSFLQAFPFCL